jgi:hypothetical protein
MKVLGCRSVRVRTVCPAAVRPPQPRLLLRARPRRPLSSQGYPSGQAPLFRAANQPPPPPAPAAQPSTATVAVPGGAQKIEAVGARGLLTLQGSQGRGGRPAPLAARLYSIRTPLPIELARDLMEVAYLWPPWLSGSCHLRLVPSGSGGCASRTRTRGSPGHGTR